MKNSQIRNEFLRTSNAVGVVSEEELRMLTGGAGDVNPETTPLTTSSWPCVIGAVDISANLCPTTKCTSKC
ncbi:MULTISPECIES: class II lanthipeptide, LchA2/BrtA2 family [Paenibacillus]|jgi:hypothetical protein|uniref:class II lanthipeptide, LchA2/BrtA2 family n=1 Tax=Paenibacillus TaxID=44249 RepID=UPI00096F8CDE|nr:MULTISPECIES: class II lanthipeptide, LchA2/BrtA2 family [unclassified Paenibacillus]OMF29601.1 lantibiotic lichenicidin A2 [Paenibacillus sp. FSL H8-0259]